jgi:hypothetical protein
MNYFTIPIQDEAMDTSNAITCQIKIGKSTQNGKVTLGLPFMKAFYTAYNAGTSKIGIALSVGSQGSITM